MNGVNKSQKNQKKTINIFDKLIHDYQNNEKEYEKLINTQSLSYQYLEGIYLKYSNNLEKYLKKNKDTVKIQANKKYADLPITLFLEESKKYKTEMIKELQARNSNLLVNFDQKDFFQLDKLMLTPLPEKVGYNHLSSLDKNAINKAEREVVMMRTFEYTNALKYQGFPYDYQLDEEQKHEIIYIYTRAAREIQKWWQKTLIKKKMKNKIKDAFNKINQVLSFSNKNYKKASGKILVERLKALNPKMNVFDSRSLYLHKTIILNFLVDYNKIKLKRNQKLFLIIAKITNIKKYFLSKYFLHWYRISKSIYSNQEVIKLVKNSHKKCLPTYLSYLPNLLRVLFKKRFNELILLLKCMSKISLGVEIFNKGIKRNILNRFYRNFQLNNINLSLKKVIINTYKKGFLWKYFQKWSLENIILKLFIQKTKNRKNNKIIFEEIKNYKMNRDKDNNLKNDINAQESNLLKTKSFNDKHIDKSNITKNTITNCYFSPKVNKRKISNSKKNNILPYKPPLTKFNAGYKNIINKKKHDQGQIILKNSEISSNYKSPKNNKTKKKGI